MSARRIRQNKWFPTHCAKCKEADIKTPATWVVTPGQGSPGLLACDSHRELLEIRGIHALQSRRARQ